MMAKESDYVSISPIPNKYCCDDEVGNEMSLPYQCDTISAQQVADVIAATNCLINATLFLLNKWQML